MSGQTWDPARYARSARFVSDYGRALLALLEPAPGERILDLGCGEGGLTVELVARGCTVVGVDASPAQVAAARARGLDARVGDAQALAFEAEFDGVLSNAALHWMTRPDAVVAGVARALRPGGRFVGEFGGHGNVARIVAALRAALARRGVDEAAIQPWYYPTATEYRARLEAGGFRVRSIELFPRATPLPHDLADWLETFAQPFLGAVPAAGRAALVAEVSDALRAALCAPDGRWTADQVRLRFAAERR